MDQPSLGLYRVVHSNVAQILDEDLLPQVQEDFHQYKAEDEAAMKDDLSKMVAAVKAADMNLDDSPEGREKRVRAVGTGRATVREPAVEHGSGDSTKSFGLARSRDRTDHVGERGLGKNEVRLAPEQTGPANAIAQEVRTDAIPLPAVQVQTVRPDQEPCWNELMRHQHYLGSRNLNGYRLRQVAVHAERWLALIGWHAAAQHCAARDCWTGWPCLQRRQRLLLE